MVDFLNWSINILDVLNNTITKNKTWDWIKF
jgi:hypothetical protein